MKVSKHYEENWERTNRWLLENAPEYVIKCMEELTAHWTLALKELKEINESLDRLGRKNFP